MTFNKHLPAQYTTTLVALLLFFSFCAFPAFSRPDSSPGITETSPDESVTITKDSTLQELLAAAALNNAGLKASFQAWQAALQRIPQVRALPNPQLSFGFFIRQIETRVGPQQAKVGIMQTFPWFGKLKLKGSAAAKAAESARLKYDALKQKLFFNVKDAYYEFYLLTRTIGILEENVKLLEHLESVLESRYRTGTVSFSNLVKIQVEREKLRDRLISATDILTPVKARLNAALNRPLSAPLPAPTLPSTVDASLPDSTVPLVKKLKETNPQLKSIEAMADKEKVSIALARKNSYPDFSIGVDYMLTGEARMPGVSDSGKDPVAAMLSLRLPIWGKKNKASVKEAGARFRAASFLRQDIENQLAARLEMAHFKFRDARRKIKLYRQSLLPRAQQALEVTRAAFEAGKAGFMDFIDSQRVLLDFQLSLEEAKTRQAQRTAEIDMLIGE